jgi:hypothetical protein
MRSPSGDHAIRSIEAVAGQSRDERTCPPENVDRVERASPRTEEDPRSVRRPDGIGRDVADDPCEHRCDARRGIDDDQPQPADRRELRTRGRPGPVPDAGGDTTRVETGADDPHLAAEVHVVRDPPAVGGPLRAVDRAPHPAAVDEHARRPRVRVDGEEGARPLERGTQDLATAAHDVVRAGRWRGPMACRDVRRPDRVDAEPGHGERDGKADDAGSDPLVAPLPVAAIGEVVERDPARRQPVQLALERAAGISHLRAPWSPSVRRGRSSSASGPWSPEPRASVPPHRRGSRAARSARARPAASG